MKRTGRPFGSDELPLWALARNSSLVIRNSAQRWAALTMLALVVWSILSAGGGSGPAPASASASGAARTSVVSSSPNIGTTVAVPDATCPSGQCFTDVPPTNPFYTFTNNLYLDSIVSGYPCGSGSEPCDPQGRPYYRPGATVSRGQMSKFVDNGRKNISDAIGHSLYISTTAGIAVDAETRSGGEGLYAECLQSGNNCYALEGYAPPGDYAGYMYNGKGVYVESDDSAQPGLDAASYGSGSYGISADSALYRGGYFKSESNTQYSLYVDDKDGPTQTTAALSVRGTIRGEGDLVINGSKAGYVVDIMQNVDSQSLEPGDVVTIVGSGTPVMGQIPLVTVKKASTAYDTGVTGVVDEVWYAPDPATKAAYDKQQADWDAAMSQRNQATAAANAAGVKPDLSKIPLPDMTITDEQGTLHSIPGATTVQSGGYASVVTLGSYKAVKVDASYGPIHAGDLLVSSPNPGYAMKATDRSLAFGATIGKALADLDSGTSLIPVMVTMK